MLAVVGVMAVVETSGRVCGSGFEKVVSTVELGFGERVGKR